ncbi:MAG: Glu/Leu/Phe/Val dehydrogenase [Bacteroidetes bacterium]|nr:Glu/Leu/Phe/Val dehydrogenase [Bacteroidota bacterium]
MIEVKDAKEIKSASDFIFGNPSFANHEQVVFCHDKDTGLKAIIAIHNTTLGPALGGTRMWNYKSDAEAVYDVLRLSRGMTYKAAISGLKLGGGKAVIFGDSAKDKTPEMFMKYGEFVERLNGKYITAEDVGTSTKDMEYIRTATKHVTGLPENMGGSGDPSPVTAYGVFMGMKASAKQKWGSDKLAGKKIAIQGVGHVGENLVRLVSEEGAKVYITDMNQAKLQDLATKYNAEITTLDGIYDVDMDIYAPCALGATLNTKNINRLKCGVVSGAANNQLADEKIHGEMLAAKGILYAPDFLINAGGLINVYSELHGYDRKHSLQHTEHIYDTTLEIFSKAVKENITTLEAAKKIAEERIEAARKNNSGSCFMKTRPF